MPVTATRLAILYEHPEWFAPLFSELDRRRIPYDRVHAADLRFDPAATVAQYPLVLNRMSPSAYLRGHGHAIFPSLAFLRHLDIMGVPVVNGAAAFGLELSKTAQISLLARLGLPHPRTRVVNTTAGVRDAAGSLAFPLLVKPNIGGSGAGIQRFESVDALDDAVTSGRLDLGIDQTALVQEYHPPVGGSIVRVEVLDGRFLYAIRVYPDPDAGFNLCPADICRIDVHPSHRTPRVEGYVPPDDVVEAVRRLAGAAHLDVGGIEYLVSERDGGLYFYDINALSNFVADAPRVVGFDPVPVFVDYLERRLQAAGVQVARATS
jgi:glutathione synthase/RimK-type ligase-like ATP-grasp enzyme